MFLFFSYETSSSSDPFSYFSHLDSNLTLLLFLIPSLVGFFGFLFVINTFISRVYSRLQRCENKLMFSALSLALLFGEY